MSWRFNKNKHKMVIAAFKKEIKHREVTVCQRVSICHSQERFCPGCEPLETAASHNQYEHARAYEPQFLNTSSL